MHPGNAPPHEPMPYRPHPGPVIYGEPPPPPHMYYHPPPPGSQYDGSGAAGTMYASRSTRNRPNKESKLHKEGFPSMVPRAQPRTRFQKHEDETLKELKEHPDNLSWKQIAEFFPGRNPGTLQVRFCTKLKKKEKIDWDPEKDSKLKDEEKRADEGKWKLIASRMGNDFTPEECRARFVDYHQAMENEDVDEEALQDDDTFHTEEGPTDQEGFRDEDISTEE